VTEEVVQRFRLDRWIETLTVQSLASKRTSRSEDKKAKGVRGVLHSLRGSGGQQLYLVGSVLLGAVLPAALIFFGADGVRLVHLLSADAGQAAGHSAPMTQHDVVITILGRVMQIVFVTIAALLPALLYFLFDREHLETLRQRFTRQIMRFDPRLRTRKEVVSRYGNLMNEAYGRDCARKILPGRRSPLLLATLVLALGWSFTLLHGDVFIVRERGIAALFEPRHAAVSFAFIGAYFYGLNAVLRGYVRKDLRPKTYSALTVRIFIVVTLAWVLELILNTKQNNALYVVAFLSGIVPETALVLIKETVRGTAGKRLRGIDDDPDPLTNLEGIDLYDRARLFDEGVTNVESLAHHDVVELMLQTRIPASRLVDWVDQAVLYLHVGPQSERSDLLGNLRGYGIRTATDLDNAFHATTKNAQKKALDTILGPRGGPGSSRLEVIHATIEDEEWMDNLRAWRRTSAATPRPIRLDVASLKEEYSPTSVSSAPGQ
jgi:hypothetical protein